MKFIHEECLFATNISAFADTVVKPTGLSQTPEEGKKEEFRRKRKCLLSFSVRDFFLSVINWVDFEEHTIFTLA